MERVVVFLDTSALVKRYVAEQGSRFVAQFFEPSTKAAVIFVSTLTYVEVIAAFSRRLPAPPEALNQLFIDDYRRGMEKIPVSAAIIERAATLSRTHRLRAADAIQLASALRIVSTLTKLMLLTADAEMIMAAQAEGLSVDNPNRYA
jgi:uncharacterized protein